MLQTLGEDLRCAQFSDWNSESLSISDSFISDRLDIGRQDFSVLGVNDLSRDIHGYGGFFSTEL